MGPPASGADPAAASRSRQDHPPLSDSGLEFLLAVLDLARSGDAGLLAQALDAGVPANLTNAAGDSLLILAAYHQRAEVVCLLLARGVDTERANDRGQTALGAAVFRRNAEIVHALLAAGADPHGGSRSASQVAEFFGLTEMATLIRSSEQSSGVSAGGARSARRS